MNKNGAATAFMLDDFDYDILSKKHNTYDGLSGFELYYPKVRSESGN